MRICHSTFNYILYTPISVFFINYNYHLIRHLLLTVILLTVSTLVNSSERTISGIVKDVNGDPIMTQMLLLQFGDILPGSNPDEVFRILARGYTERGTGLYSLAFNSEGIVHDFIAARYGSPEYYVFQKIVGKRSDATKHFVIPEVHSQNISLVWQIVKNKVIIDPSKVIFALAIVETGKKLIRRTVNMTTREYIFNKDRNIYDLPKGVYIARLAIFNENDVTQKPMVKTISISLPIDSKDKILSFSFP